MNGEQLIADRITTDIQRLGNTGDSMVVSFGDVFWQAASFPDEVILVEVAGIAFLPQRRRLDETGRARRVALGFNEPDADMPNWWIAIESGRPPLPFEPSGPLPRPSPRPSFTCSACRS